MLNSPGYRIGSQEESQDLLSAIVGLESLGEDDKGAGEIFAAEDVGHPDLVISDGVIAVEA